MRKPTHAVSLRQSLRKLGDYADAGVELYDVLKAGDAKVCDHCNAVAAAGPYAIESRTFTDATHCPTCRCSVRARV